MSVHISKAKYLLSEVSITTLRQNILHMKSVHMTEAKYLLLEVSTTTLSPCISQNDVSTNDVSTHDWGKVSSGRGLYFYIES